MYVCMCTSIILSIYLPIIHLFYYFCFVSQTVSEYDFERGVQRYANKLIMIVQNITLQSNYLEDLQSFYAPWQKKNSLFNF